MTIDTDALIRAVRENPEFRQTLRRELLTQELLELPERFAAYAAATDRRLESLERDVADLKAGQVRLEQGQARIEETLVRHDNDIADLKSGQARLEQGQVRLEQGQVRLEQGQVRLEATQARQGGDISRLAGKDYEALAARVARRRLRSVLGITDAQRIENLPDVLEAAQFDGRITDQEAGAVELADLVLRGTDPDGEETFIVAEASVTVQAGDVARARRRAEIMQKATGISAVPVVIGESIEPDAAGEGNVTFLEVHRPPD